MYVEGRVLRDHGTIMTDSAGEVNLEKDTVHFLPRAEVELLIRQGILEQSRDTEAKD